MGTKKFKIVIKESQLKEAKFQFSWKGIAMASLETRGWGPNVRTLIIYYAQPGFGTKNENVKVAGAVTMMPTEEPCVPDTLEVATIYTDEEFRGVGLGSFLYAMAFYYANSNGYGLTSDHSIGSKEKATNKWKQLEKNPQSEKRTTKDGNSKFDYDGDTPDPDDDCDEGSGEVAIDYSLFNTKHEAFSGVWSKLLAAHTRFSSMTRGPRRFEERLSEMASDGFNRAYDLEPKQ